MFGKRTPQKNTIPGRELRLGGSVAERRFRPPARGTPGPWYRPLPRGPHAGWPSNGFILKMHIPLFFLN